MWVSILACLGNFVGFRGTAKEQTCSTLFSFIFLFFNAFFKPYVISVTYYVLLACYIPTNIYLQVWKPLTFDIQNIFKTAQFCGIKLSCYYFQFLKNVTIHCNFLLKFFFELTSIIQALKRNKKKEKKIEQRTIKKKLKMQILTTSAVTLDASSNL